MRVLHVAALPFPSPQGTQGLLHAMLMAHAEAGHDAHLLCYPGHELDLPYTVHRCAAPRPISQRSGPSWQKLALDGALARAFVKLARQGFDLIVAHHVEAAALALALRIPAHFYAHTDLAAELPSYFAPALARPLRWLGARDRVLARCMPTFAVSPLLASRVGGEVPPLPWTIPPPIADEERIAARSSLALQGKRVALYAGNLDRYQGLQPAIAAIARSDLHWVIATESPIRDFARALYPFFGRVRFARLNDERARRRAYAACDFAIVPRDVPGGIPIKLFDALARGVPVVATRNALAGYPFERFCTVVDREWRFELTTEDARPYLRTAHAPARFAAELSARAGRQGAARA
ncbi:MAG TPA: glycosyltransferase [Polyangiales bacterium]|nr:glycosyltransferase [Polyangiales bacterium]